MKKPVHFNTQVIHGGQAPDKAYGAVMPPIYQTSTYAQNKPGDHSGYEYSRTQNPTRTALEKNLAHIEQGEYGLAFASGLAAIDAVMKLLQPGDRVIASNDLYGGSYRLFTQVFEPMGIDFVFMDLTQPEAVAQKIHSQTRLIWIETPTNPMMRVVDIAAYTALAKSKKLWVAVDNTFASPYLQQPLVLGADIVMHSATKYLAGHSDLILGALIVNDFDLHKKLAFIQNASGAVPGPMDCFLTLRGIKTLSVRMQRHCENAAKIAMYLAEHSKIASVNWPGFESHPQHHIAKNQMNEFGAMLSFVPMEGSLEQALSLLQRFKLFTLAESLGGVESLVGHPASMTHASIPKKEREAQGVVGGLIRLSVGIEQVEDLIADLDQAIG
ncbi:MAG: cystathionine gamma-synthase [Flavobacteriaceae bacterium]